MSKSDGLEKCEKYPNSENAKESPKWVWTVLCSTAWRPARPKNGQQCVKHGPARSEHTRPSATKNSKTVKIELAHRCFIEYAQNYR